jgi:type II secretory pathway pseudopilin PulG
MKLEKTVDGEVARWNLSLRDKSRCVPQRAPTHPSSGRSNFRAFTLIDLLAVIAIIGVLAGMVVGLSGIAIEKQRASRIRTEHTKLMTAIESYKAELGNYPPDNPDRTTWRDDNPKSYRERCGRNPLFYELSGAVFEAGNFTVVSRDASAAVPAASLKKELGVGGIENSSRQKREILYRGVNFKRDEVRVLDNPDKVQIELLVVPLKGPNDADFKILNSAATMNPWFYDSSSTNRHNETFDLWTEYLAGKKTNVFGNWKE